MSHVERRSPAKISYLWIVVLLLIVGAALRIGMLAQDVRFHPDEALYATFARRISLHGDFLLSDAPLDKPPLAFLTVAGSFSAFGLTEFSARLPSLFSSILSLAVVYNLARRFYADRRVALLALALLALSPLDLAFAATVFVDPLLTFLLLLACLFASRDHWFASGVAFALALATKQSALEFVPLILPLGFICNARSTRRWRSVVWRLLRVVLPVLIGWAILSSWSSSRAAAIDFWTLNTINNSPGRFIRADEILPRLQRWLFLLGTTTGFAPLLALAVVPPLALFSRLRSRETLIDALLGIVILGLLLAYWLIAFNTYDRYVHSLGPLALLLVARGIILLECARYRRNFRVYLLPIARLVLWLTVVCELPFTVIALRGQLDIGGDQGSDTGIDRLAALLNALPVGRPVYDYSLDWELDFYLGDGSHVHPIFEPSPQALARAACSSDETAYFAAPIRDAIPWFIPLREHGATITANSALLSDPIWLYEVRCTF